MNRLLLLLTTLTLCLPVGAQQVRQDLYTSIPDQRIYRIPAIAKADDGTLIAISDCRYDHGSDVGNAKPIDIMCRLSHDNGLTWESERELADCHDAAYRGHVYGFGDAAVVADRDSDRQMVLCVGDSTGRTVFQHGFQQVYRFYGTDHGATWSRGENITSQIYSLVPQLDCLFIGSGKIHQSRYVKRGQYYRLYCALVSLHYGNAVIYSDDFGQTWSLLGTTESCCPEGDEPKTEELPDGSVILSSRTKGRWFNIFHFDDDTFTTGHWEQPERARDIVCLDNACNGEILVLPVVDHQSGCATWLALQSVPYGPKRTHVSIYYKPLSADAFCNPQSVSSGEPIAATLGQDWQRYEVTTLDSGYSTFCLTADGHIAFLYERTSTPGSWQYDICFERLSLDQITDGRYALRQTLTNEDSR